MELPRISGILLHPTSLPGGHGIGDLGPPATSFLDFLSAAKQGLWQMLPLAPTGFGDSPYQTLSAFAGNPTLISLDLLAADGLIEPTHLREMPRFRDGIVAYQVATAAKLQVLHRAHDCFTTYATPRDRNDYESFCAQQHSWLDEFSLFMALRVKHHYVEWAKWDGKCRDHNVDTLAAISLELRRTIDFIQFLQWLFFKQWKRLRNEAHKRNILLMGDIPMYVAWDSCDVWSAKQFWHLNELDGSVMLRAGVEPDHFSEIGQLWGNPVYNWDAMRHDRFGWWVRRFKASFDMFDWLRMDHFRGFDNYWAVPAGRRRR